MSDYVFLGIRGDEGVRCQGLLLKGGRVAVRPRHPWVFLMAGQRDREHGAELYTGTAMNYVRNSLQHYVQRAVRR